MLGDSWGNTHQNNNNYSDAKIGTQQPVAHSNDFDSYSDEDDDYAPLQMGTWGTQKGKDDTPQFNVSVGGWSSLIDPNFKIKEGGLGSGNLHRRGGNYKPVDEQYILNQRLKNQPVPKSAIAKSKSKPHSAAPVQGAPKGKGGYKKSNEHPPSYATRPAPPSTTRVPRSSGGASGWGSAPLVDKPFWEQPATASANTSQTGSYESKYASNTSQQSTTVSQQPSLAPPAQQQSVFGTRGASESKWATASPASSAPQPPQQSQWSATKPASSTSSSSGNWVSGSAASKYAPKENREPVQQQAPAPQKSDIIFSFNIELAPGIYAPLPVYRGVDYLELVNRFEESHHLRIEDEAKQSFASKIAILVNHQLGLRGELPQN